MVSCNPLQCSAHGHPVRRETVHRAGCTVEQNETVVRLNDASWIIGLCGGAGRMQRGNPGIAQSDPRCWFSGVCGVERWVTCSKRYCCR